MNKKLLIFYIFLKARKHKSECRIPDMPLWIKDVRCRLSLDLHFFRSAKGLAYV